MTALKPCPTPSIIRKATDAELRVTVTRPSCWEPIVLALPDTDWWVVFEGTTEEARNLATRAPRSRRLLGLEIRQIGGRVMARRTKPAEPPAAATEPEPAEGETTLTETSAVPVDAAGRVSMPAIAAALSMDVNVVESIAAALDVYDDDLHKTVEATGEPLADVRRVRRALRYPAR